MLRCCDVCYSAGNRRLLLRGRKRKSAERQRRKLLRHLQSRVGFDVSERDDNGHLYCDRRKRQSGKLHFQNHRLRQSGSDYKLRACLYNGHKPERLSAARRDYMLRVEPVPDRHGRRQLSRSRCSLCSAGQHLLPRRHDYGDLHGYGHVGQYRRLQFYRNVIRCLPPG